MLSQKVILALNLIFQVDIRSGIGHLAERRWTQNTPKLTGYKFVESPGPQVSFGLFWAPLSQMMNIPFLKI